MWVKGSSSAATPKPMRIAASVVPQKNASVRMPSRPTRRRSPVAVGVTGGGGQRPVAALCGPLNPGLAERLARAGFAVVSFDPPGAPGLEVALDALGRGVLDVDADSYALIEPRDDGSIALARAAAGVRVPGLVVGDMPVDLAAAAIVQWLADHPRGAASPP